MAAIDQALVSLILNALMPTGAAGFPVYVHTGIKIGHMKTSMI